MKTARARIKTHESLDCTDPEQAVFIQNNTIDGRMQEAVFFREGLNLVPPGSFPLNPMQS
ncbi:hypothetical protein BWI96_20220 [Siphonobacter sp. SORGH_AS_0500]|uniref:hypothetical protein n=1 Tax=Siphonobacter sp. SORGH_AS_0500 TaxID=1864824 RepID=UPI000CBDCF13|nr:hypothetical protein [Siphonobacter sp. SORGH_AS_0500]PKK34851.1 hypothetical protein BWI96_20220 [Siphonobacter sp. SORGH_AS_0500]